MKIFFYRPQTKLRKGNVFTPVCQSFCSQGGCLCPSACWDTPPGQTPPPADSYCCGRSASYWNAFLLFEKNQNVWTYFVISAWLKKSVKVDNAAFSKSAQLDALDKPWCKILLIIQYMDHWMDNIVNSKSKAYGEKENSITGILISFYNLLFQNSLGSIIDWK